MIYKCEPPARYRKQGGRVGEWEDFSSSVFPFPSSFDILGLFQGTNPHSDHRATAIQSAQKSASL